MLLPQLLVNGTRHNMPAQTKVLLRCLLRSSTSVSTPQRCVRAPVIKSRDSASFAMTQQLQQQSHINSTKGFLTTPPRFTLRSVNCFTAQSVQHGKIDIAMQPGQ